MQELISVGPIGSCIVSRWWSIFVVAMMRFPSTNVMVDPLDRLAFYRAMLYTERGIACLSVRPSVTLVDCDHIHWDGGGRVIQ